MNTYNINWKGLDRGHESAWGPDIWLGVLRLFGKYSPVDLSDAKSTFYSELIEKFPDTQWLSDDGSGQFRNFFRDGREPWSSTGVVDFNSKTQIAEITDVGKKVNDGYVSYADVLAVTALSYEESGEKPFRIILEALRSTLDKGLHFEDIARVMRHYRQGDSLLEVLALPNEVLTSNNKRRLRAILLIMMYSGLVIQFKDRYYSGQDPEIRDLKLTTTEKTFPLNVDRLSIALKLFAEKRSVDKPGGWSSYDDWTKGVRTEFVAVDEVLLDDSSFDYLAYIRKFGISWQVANTKFAAHSDEEKRAVLKFLKEHKDSPKPASWYIDVANRLVVGGNQVKGMSSKAVLYFMSELHPEEFAAWTEPTYEQLAYLGLHKGAVPSDLTIATYEDCKAKQHQIIARMKELGIGKATEDATDPDYRTVNEFLWWLGQDDNKDLLKEKIMAKMFKNASKKTKTGERKLSKAVENDEMMQRLMAALRTKPFAILAGHSGTGKSQLVRRLAYMTCNDEELLKEKDNSNAPGNYCMVQVKPNWHDSTDLLGYYTEMNGGKYHITPFVEFICKAYAYPETPFFVCLDEMNLAPVEQYFAEFLSAIESYSETTKLTDRLITEKASPEEICGETKLAESLEEVKKHGLTIPRNLFVVGTVNVDETTCQFSRKVLDRAMTILMTAVSFKSMTEPNDPSKEECLDPDGIKFFLERPTQTSLVQGQMDKLDAIQKQVGDTPFAIAYRFANEYALYQSAYQMLMSKGLNSDGTSNPEDDDSQKAAIDHVVLMKLLPRIHGSRPEMEVWFNGKNGDVNKIGLVKTLGDGQSVDMMKSILARVGEYLSFWP